MEENRETFGYDRRNQKERKEKGKTLIMNYFG